MLKFLTSSILAGYRGGSFLGVVDVGVPPRSLVITSSEVPPWSLVITSFFVLSWLSPGLDILAVDVDVILNWAGLKDLSLLAFRDR